MELWIRSQDKELLVKVKDIELGDFDEEKCLVVNNLQNIGKYKTKERALEVLDEIQNFICIEIHENNLNYEKADLILKGKIVDSLCKIYQMPKE